MEQTVAVVGAAGHVGLGLSVCVADAGHHVFGIDIDESAVATVSAGKVPFVEDGAEEALHRVLSNGCLTMTTDNSVVARSDVVIVIMGTPIDENLNPVILPLLRLLATLKPHFRKGQLIILRSTVSPGTADTVRTTIENLTGLEVGRDLYLVFAPERVLQGKSLQEIPRLPQLVGAYEDASFLRAKEFFETFVRSKCLQLTPVEAELGKLMCNMARYVTLAIANEFSLIAKEYDANVHRIFDACSFEYPRFNLPTPGPNVAGPCLFKDGFFLIERVPFPELVLTAFKINESMPMHIFKMIKSKPEIHKVVILGLTFKAGNDDTRYSLSFKLKKLLEAAGYEVSGFDPLLPEWNDRQALRGSECAILMTPHAQFADLGSLMDWIAEERCWYIDLWGFWPEMRSRSQGGCFYAHDVEAVMGAREARRKAAA